MRVIDINGRLATAGSWDETSQSEAAAQARLRATRTGLRAMLAGNEAFHVDPMAGGKSNADKDLAQENEALVAAQQLASTESASGAALICTKTEPEDEVWHTEAPTVCGVYIASCARKLSSRRHWNGVRWSLGWVDGTDGTDGKPISALKQEAGKQPRIEWLRLIEADTPAPAAQIPDWRHGDKVLQNERTGLWHLKDRNGISPARRHDRLLFWPEFLYRPAAPGVCEGDYYDESSYPIQA